MNRIEIWNRLGWHALGMVGIFSLVGMTWAEDAPPRSLKIAAITGEFAGQDVDAAEKYKERTHVVLFVNSDRWDRPIARYLKKLDSDLSEGIDEAPDAVATVVWLTDDKEKAKEYLPKAQQSLGLSRTAWTVFPGDKSGPVEWNVDVASTLTVVVLKKEKEVGRFAYVSTNDQDVPEAISALKKSAE